MAAAPTRAEKVFSCGNGRLLVLSATNSTAQSSPRPRMSPTTSPFALSVRRVSRACLKWAAGLPGSAESAAATKFFCLQVAQDGASGGERDGVCVVGEAVQKSSGAGGDGVDHFLAGEDGTERGVSAGESFGGDQDVGTQVPVFQEMFDGEIAAGAAHAGHDFVGDTQDAVTAADFRDGRQISRRWNDCSESGAAHWFEEEGGGLAISLLVVRGFDGTFQFGGVLLAAVAAAVGAIEVAAVAVGHADVRELFHHRQIDFAAASVAGNRERAQG